jgi:hypothetical protein
LSNDGLVLSGRGEAGATVTVIGEGGIDLGTAVVDANGNFSVNLNSAQINGEQLSASQSDVAGNESNSVSLTAPDRVAPDAAGNLAFAGGGSLLNGTGEAGAAVRVLAADGSVLGTPGARRRHLPGQLASPQANGQQVQVVLTDAAGNQSAASAITAPDTTPPTAPGELAVSGDGVTLTGRGEVARVTVTNPAGEEIGSATVDASGHFTITLNPALGNAELLSFTQADAAGNVSAVATLQTPDFTPPDPLTQVVINADGSVVSGLGEAGATVIVSNAAGTVLGTGTCWLMAASASNCHPHKSTTRHCRYCRPIPRQRQPAGQRASRTSRRLRRQPSCGSMRQVTSWAVSAKWAPPCACTSVSRRSVPAQWAPTAPSSSSWMQRSSMARCCRSP